MKKTISLWKRIAMPLALTIAALCSLPGWSKLQAQSSNLQVSVAAQSPGKFQLPQDAAPDHEGDNIFFIATGPNGPGVFRVCAPGTASAQGKVGHTTGKPQTLPNRTAFLTSEVFAGQPFVAPTGIAIGCSGLQMYIADPQAFSSGGQPGRIFAIPIEGGAPVPVPGTEGTAPRGMDVISEGGGEMIYFSGKDPRSGEVGVFKIPGIGDRAPRVVAVGSPLVEPDGVAVTRAGTVYVTDRAAAGGCLGSVLKIGGGKISKLVDMVRTGNPAGIALSLDDSLLLVSVIQPNDYDQLLLVHLDTLQTESFTRMIGQNRNSSGGVHRAGNRNVFAWADRNGTIFQLKHQ